MSENTVAKDREIDVDELEKDDLDDVSGGEVGSNNNNCSCGQSSSPGL